MAANISEAILNTTVNSYGYFSGQNPFDHTLPVILMQLFVTSSAAILISTLLKPLGLPEMISQIIAGILLGPSCLGRFDVVKNVVFNPAMSTSIDTYSALGVVFQVFLIGVQVNPMMILKAGRKATTIGVSVVAVPLMLSVAFAVIATNFAQLDETASKTLMVVGIVESMTAFPVIACYLAELNILNSEFSRVAFTSTMISGLLCFLCVTGLFTHYAPGALFENVTHLSIYAVELLVIICVLRPVIVWMIKQTPEGKKVKGEYLSFVFISLLLLEYACMKGKVEKQFGPFVFGMSIPCGPPMGSALVERLEFFNTWMVMPFFYTKHGMSMDIFEVDLRMHIMPILVILITCIGKFMGAFLPALYHKMSYNDAVSLGLSVNAQGFIEISLFSILKEMQVIDRLTFDLMSIWMIIASVAFTPLVRYLYDSSMKYKNNNRRTIQHSEPNTELNIVACVYDQENVPSIIHLLKASNPTTESPIDVTVVHFVELVGHATPVIISHKKSKRLLPTTSISERIVNVFQHYEENGKRSVLVNPYTVVSPYTSLHNDLCTLALQKRASLVVLPFHRNLATGDVNSGIRTANCNVLHKAPCSVGVLIDRGLLSGLKFVFENWMAYNVAVVFYGGLDDREALSHGERMSGCPTITLTVIRILVNGDDSTDTERIEDEEVISDFRSRSAHNNRVRYIEVKVQQGFEVVKVFESIGEGYELIILGRRHDANSQLILELTEWNKCSELGTIGDIFVNSGCGGQATILVLQQQTLVSAPARDPVHDREILTRTKSYDC